MAEANNFHLEAFCQSLLQSNCELQFADSIGLIDRLYRFTCTAFTNGNQHNLANQNNGSCKCFAFGQLQQLSELQTLRLFGQHFRHVVDHPEGTDHPNIRQFMLCGWAGIKFAGQALATK